MSISEFSEALYGFEKILPVAESVFGKHYITGELLFVIGSAYLRK